MSCAAVLLEQIQPDGGPGDPALFFGSKNCCKYFGMLFVVLAHRTTTEIGRRNFGVYFGLINVLAPVPTVGLLPLISCRTNLPCASQPNRFWVLVGLHAGLPVQVEFRHFAEWKVWAMYLPTEYGTIAFGLFANCESIPSFC